MQCTMLLVFGCLVRFEKAAIAPELIRIKKPEGMGWYFDQQGWMVLFALYLLYRIPTTWKVNQVLHHTIRWGCWCVVGAWRDRIKRRIVDPMTMYGTRFTQQIKYLGWMTVWEGRPKILFLPTWRILFFGSYGTEIYFCDWPISTWELGRESDLRNIILKPTSLEWRTSYRLSSHHAATLVSLQEGAAHVVPIPSA